MKWFPNFEARVTGNRESAIGNGTLNFKPRLIVKLLNAREARITRQLINLMYCLYQLYHLYHHFNFLVNLSTCQPVNSFINSITFINFSTSSSTC
jgi:hypothetical protein